MSLLILALVTLQRLGELVLARRNTMALLAQGGFEVGASHYPAMVAFHAAWLVGLWWMAWNAAISWPWLVMFLGLQAARVWVIASLGRRWTTRIIVVPGEALVRRGPYRFIRHPNYAVVAGEIFVLPMVFGLTSYAVALSLAHCALAAWRIRAEETALAPYRA
jgi:methyltransferase